MSDKARDDFEAWFLSGPGVFHDDVERLASGHYKIHVVQTQWAAWQAGVASQQREIDRLREELGEAISLLEGADMDLMSWLEARDKFLNKSTTARGE